MSPVRLSRAALILLAALAPAAGAQRFAGERIVVPSGLGPQTGAAAALARADVDGDGRDDLILPGRFSTLGRTRENVHDLVAGPDGARVLDAFTYFKRGARSYFMQVDADPRDAEQRIYDASWA